MKVIICVGLSNRNCIRYGNSLISIDKYLSLNWVEEYELVIDFYRLRLTIDLVMCVR